MITVIVPILNAMPYLPKALASLERQLFQDFEVCLWGNGSLVGRSGGDAADGGGRKKKLN